MDLNILRVAGLAVVLSVILIAGFLAVKGADGWGWFLFVALLMTGGIFG